MNEWTVVTTIVTLLGLILTILSPLLKLNTSITRIHAALTPWKKMWIFCAGTTPRSTSRSGSPTRPRTSSCPTCK